MEEQHNNHEKFRLKMTQKRKKIVIARNKCDGALEDVSVLTKETKGKKAKKSSSEAFQTMSIQVQIANRRSQDEALSEKRQLQKQRLALFGLAQAKAIIQDYPDIMKQCIEFLASLAEQDQFSTRTKNAFNKFSIAQYYTKLYTKGATHFYKYSTALLNQRILDIIQEFHNSQLKYPPSINIKIQILAHLFKSALYFQRYIPRQVSINIMHLKMTCVAQALNITTEYISQLRHFYLSNSPRITYLDDFNLCSLANTYYFIILKQKVLSVKYSIQLDYEVEKEVKKLKIHRTQAMEKEKFSTEFKDKEVQCKYSLSELCTRTQTVKKGKGTSVEELLQRIQSYERLLELQNLKNSLGYETIKRMAQLEAVNYDCFKNYQRKKRKLLEKNGNNLSKLKDELITKQLIRNPYCSYEEVFSHIYHRNALYIERSYFEGNFHRLLEKETHYQQLRYLEKVFKGIIQCKSKENVFFIDRCSLIEGRESSAIVAVSLTGALHCEKSPDSQHFLIEIEKLFLKTKQKSIVLLFDDEFPFSARLEETKEQFMISKEHTLCFLPRASLVPNPCMAIANNLKQMLAKQCSLEEAIQTVFKEFNRARVMDVAQKEWEKAQRLAFPDNPQCKEQSETSKDERADSKSEEGSDLEDNQVKEEDEEEDVKEEEDENEGIKFIFPRQSRERSSTFQPLPSRSIAA